MNSTLLPLLILSIVHFSSHAEEIKTETSLGIAKDDSGKVVYKETHSSRFLKKKLIDLKTNYFLEDGKSFGSITSHFTHNPFVPNYKFEDIRNHRQAEIKWFGDEVISYAKESKESKKSKKLFKIKKNTVAGQGLHNFLRSHLGEFKKNTDLVKEVDFLIPMNQDRYQFRVKVLESTNNGETLKLRIEADSWVFRLIAPHIDVTYDTKTSRLLEYKGPSNLLDENRDKMNVTIRYEYETK